MGRTIGRADMNGSDYKDASELQVVTLENAIYLSMKNDVAYVLHDKLFIYEQRSTKNANMPLRCLFYASDTYSVLVKEEYLWYEDASASITYVCSVL